MSLTLYSEEPKVAKNAMDIVSRINPKYHFPGNLKTLERQIRISFGLPVKGRMGGQTPYGYIYNKANDTYEPVDEVFGLLWQARRYLYNSPLRETADWLNFKAEKLGYETKISHMGLRNVMILRPPYEECLLPREEKEKIIESLCLMTKNITS
jgi:hypothetical protein